MFQNLDQNKKNAIAFYLTAYKGKPRKAVEKYVGNEYIQHNPAVKDGKEGFIEYFEKMSKEYPNKRIEFVRSIAEGNLVALHTIKLGLGMMSILLWIFFDLMSMEK